jgi:membrane protein YdbS with pleckstrin-like domain
MAEDDEKEIAAEKGIPAKAPAGGEPAFKPLDRRVVRLWRTQNLMVCGPILAAATVAVGLLRTWQHAPPFLAPALFAGALALVTLLPVWLPGRRFAAHTYRVDGLSLELRSGIMWRKSVLIPVSRVQHLDLQRGPLERRFGLATLQVHTAGTSNAVHSIPGLDADVALHLREELAASANLVIQ